MFTKIDVSDGYFYRVNKGEKLTKCAEWAKETAYAKASYTADTWQKRPNKYAKFTDIFYGDLAKNIVRDFLEQKIPNISIVEYDEIRKDDFKEHDKFDLMISGKEIEVKSSLEKYTKSVIDLYTNRRIIVNVYGPHETLSDFVVQVFFVPENLRRFEEIEKNNKLNPSMSEEETNKKCIEEMNYACNSTNIYVAGFINKEMEQNAIDKAKKENQAFRISNSSVNAGRRAYAQVLIKDSKHMDELVDAANDLMTKNF